MGHFIKKILVAEDDPVSLRIIETVLRKWGYDVICAKDGAQAWDLYIRDEDIQFIISDWMMPNKDGIEFCRLMRRRQGRRYTYFILLTAKSQVQDIVVGMEAGADDFITKPFNDNELRARMKAGERVVGLENILADKVTELSVANTQMQEDLEAAAIVLKAMLPPEQATLRGIKYSSRFIPCDHIGGDLFNIVSLDDNKVGIYILDVSGHGVPSALQAVSMGKVLSPYDPNVGVLIKNGAQPGSKQIVPPTKVAGELNHWFDFTESGGKFATFLYGILDTNTWEFTFMRAGHQYPILISDGESRRIPSTEGIPIGITADFKYDETTITLNKTDRLYFYTDGLSDAQNPEDKRFGDGRIREYLKNACHVSLDESISGLIGQITKWREGADRTDDMSILGIELTS